MKLRAFLLVVGWASASMTFALQPLLAQVIDDPVVAAQNEDFLIQGEYVSDSRGLQVIALGDSDFDCVIYEGGLPGAGWRKEPPRRLQIDADAVQQLIASMEMSKVERTSPTLDAKAPAGATQLFDGSQASLNSHWQSDAKRTADGLLMQGATTKHVYRDYTLHLEFRTPFQPKDSGQGRGNSGVYHQGRYETQVLDSFGLEGLNNETGGIYTVRDPDLNMCLPPLTWQTYDVDFTAARFDLNGDKTSDAKLTVRLNGITVQSDIAVSGPTRAAPLNESAEDGPIYLQDHGNPVRFRNIWILPRVAERDSLRPRIPGYERFYAAATEPAQQVDAGHLLIDSLGCRNCHGGESSYWATAKGPVLTGVVGRIRPDQLVRWIAAPHSEKAGTTMPDMLHGMTVDQREQASLALASYLMLATEPTRLLDRAGDRQSAERGNVLFHSIGCIACHSPQEGGAVSDATSIPLGNLPEKYTLDSLTQFLADPHAIRPEGRMPRVVADANEARDIATYLLRDTVLVPGGQQFLRTVYRGWWDNLPDFDKLTPVDAPSTVDDLSFDGIQPLDGFAARYEAFLPITTAGDYRFTIGSDDGSRVLLNGEEIVRVDGVHPYQTASGVKQLGKGVHRLVVEYFEGGGEERLTLEIEGADIPRSPAATLVTQDPSGVLTQSLVVNHFSADAKLVDEGKRLFQSLRCANCHAFAESGSNAVAGTPAKAFHSVDPYRGCLADNRSTLGDIVADTAVKDASAMVPNYDLVPAQIAAIRAALDGEPETGVEDAAVVHRAVVNRAVVNRAMVFSNCYACHVRDQLGGAEADRDTYFQTTMMEMGNEGRVPPPLDGMGAKLTDVYVATILQQGANDRPYMKTRMPAFGYEALRKFHESVNRVDQVAQVQLTETEASDVRLVSDGRTLVGNEGLACIKCHTFNGESTPGIQAIDMVKMTNRLRPEWFDRYLREPQKYRPGTRMPASFPEGLSVLKSIADGDPNYQIRAMWRYLSDGSEAKAPAGLKPGAIELVVGDRPILYRNFLTGMSPRGIAVGYPERVHLAWDADTMALSRLWQNQFLDAALHWVGRGQGRLDPLGDAVIDWEKQSAIASLESLQGSWPEQTDKAHGYQFLGYRLNALGQPTFRYRTLDALVEDFPVPVAGVDGQAGWLRRQIKVLTADTPMVFRAAKGDITTQNDGSYRVDRQVTVKISGVEIEQVNVGNSAELRAMLPANSTIEIDLEVRW